MEEYTELLEELALIDNDIVCEGNNELEVKVQRLTECVITLVNKVADLESELKMMEIIK